MIEKVYVQSHLTFNCDTCGTEEYSPAFKYNVQELIDKYYSEHKEHNCKVTIENQFMDWDPEYRSPYVCSGCEVCAGV